MFGLGIVLLALALLYFWLIGHWFARVLVAIGLFALFGSALIIGASISRYDPSGGGAFGIIGGFGLLVAWPLASLPIIYWRRRLPDAAHLIGTVY
jgi:hypothetical protein